MLIALLPLPPTNPRLSATRKPQLLLVSRLFLVPCIKNTSAHLALDHRPLRVDEQVLDGVDAQLLIVRNAAHRLLAHRALVRVARRLQ